MDEKGERERKSFSGTTKAEVTKKMTDYVADFNDALQELPDSIESWSKRIHRKL
jgi:hypothetical protein